MNNLLISNYFIVWRSNFTLLWKIYNFEFENKMRVYVTLFLEQGFFHVDEKWF